MPREADSPDRGTLSLPELDPLLNPILAQNMSRWAAVYFSNAPENREQAVLELLRQLEAEDAAREGITNIPKFVPEDVSVPESFTDSQTAEAQRQSVDCQACGQENPADNNFCCMCGAWLARQPSSGQEIEDVPQAEPVLSVDHQESYLSQHAQAIDEPAISHRESVRVPPDPDFRSSNYALRFGRDSEPASSSYRVYILAAVAILAPALILFAWRGRQATSESSPAATQAPLTVAEQPAPPAPPQSPPTRTAAAPVRTEPPAVASSQGKAERVSDKAVARNGSAELAIALSFLNSADGKQRNSEEAVQWLWKAVAKRNTDATLRLSDLYLKGDGVSKNCDQARVLLDAASSRGIRGAAERLRHLQAFGCE